MAQIATFLTDTISVAQASALKSLEVVQQPPMLGVLAAGAVICVVHCLGYLDVDKASKAKSPPKSPKVFKGKSPKPAAKSPKAKSTPKSASKSPRKSTPKSPAKSP